MLQFSEFFINCIIIAGLNVLSFVIINLMIRYKYYFLVPPSRAFLDMVNHQNKKTTPTMGGLVFYLIIPVLYMIEKGSNQFWFIALTASLSGLIGAIDDWYKIRYEHGLKVKIKFLIQMIFALISGIFFYCLFPLELYINCFEYNINLGWGYIFWIMWVIMSTTHSVNLIDGIDGLAINQMLIIQTFSPCIFFGNSIFLNLFWIVFRRFNSFPARIFMGDVGAFFLGGYIASYFITMRCELLLIPTCIVFVINSVMIMMQFLYYKINRKRLFSFTPYHHALERKGWSENKICAVYSIITFIGSICATYFYIKYFKIN